MITDHKELCKVFADAYKLHIEEANFAKGLIPKDIILDRTRNIHSYVIFCQVSNELTDSEYWEDYNHEKRIKQILSLQYSELDRPLFIVFQDCNHKFKTIEGNFLREAILENQELDIKDYILSKSDNFDEIIPIIRKEL